MQRHHLVQADLQVQLTVIRSEVDAWRAALELGVYLHLLVVKDRPQVQAFQ